jgi:uncharacterized protein YecE (DUF72 family)
MTHATDIHIGTSGWHYDHWIGPFYPPETRPQSFLEYYVRHFKTVEINNTFYRLPTQHAVMEWRDGSPPGFVFAAKGSRFITHMKKLKDPETSIQRYFEPIELLGDKLGPIVFQLPPRWHLNLDRLADFLKAPPKRWRYAFEFRDESWFDPHTYELLAEHQAALCLYDYAGRQAPVEVTADFVYIRLHGPGGAYQGSYSDDALAMWTRRMLSWRVHRISVYCYFDNDEQGYAPINALTLARLVAAGSNDGSCEDPQRSREPTPA